MRKHKIWTQVLGKFQPPTEEHFKIIQSLLDKGENILILLRKEDPDDTKSFYTQKERFDLFCDKFPEETKNGRIILSTVPDITTISYVEGET